MQTNFSLPKEILDIAKKLEDHGYESYLVGGCVRDIYLGITPKDWDFTTNAVPSQITEIFTNTFIHNEYGTVSIVNEETADSTLKVIEITPYRTESTYSDARRPDTVAFGASLEEDLKRRDFTINAIAYSPTSNTVIDIFDGESDLKAKKLRAVGNANERFSEDALRMMRAVRLATELEFVIENTTMDAIVQNAHNLSRISMERIRDEFIRVLNSRQPMQGIIFFEKLGLLPYIAPDLLRGIGVLQNQAHAFDVYEHILRSMQHAADKNWDFDIRLAALLHDISKPETRQWSEEKKDWTFYGHEVVGARVTKKILTTMRFPRETVERVSKLVRWHMFFSDPDQMTLSAVRRTIRNVGEENIWDLLKLRRCDRIGTGRPKEQPFRLRRYTAMVEEALRDPLSVKMLAIDGKRIMEITGENPGPRLGYTLHALLEEIIDDPSLNTPIFLEKKARELIVLPLTELKVLGETGKARLLAEEKTAIKELQKKHNACC